MTGDATEPASNGYRLIVACAVWRGVRGEVTYSGFITRSARSGIRRAI